MTAMDQYVIRSMRPEDIDGIMTVQQKAYFAIEPEQADVMLSRFLCAPNCCFVCEKNNRIYGYLLGHPWSGDRVPPLHKKLETLPQPCEFLYLHDMAVAPEARGHGIAKKLFEQFRITAFQLKLRSSRLVAIQGAEKFWAALGYRIIRTEETYGTSAFVMSLDFDSLPFRQE